MAKQVKKSKAMVSPYARFAAELQQHVRAEEKALAAYERLLTLQDPVVSLVAGLILEDERHHHSLMLHTGANLAQPDYVIRRATELGGQVPEEPAERAARSVSILAAEEAKNVEGLRGLAKQYLKDPDILARLVTEWMALDSQKHETLLKLLAEYLEQQVASAREQRIALETGAL